MIEGFLPVYNDFSRVLILGSFPSVRSREEAFYYGNPRNRFWRLLSEAFGEEIGATKEAKTDFLLRRGIALWDVVAACEIVGSLDTNIKNPVIADVKGLLLNAPIERILCNGRKSYALLKRHFPELVPMATPLPSTSPANVRFDRESWVTALMR